MESPERDTGFKDSRKFKLTQKDALITSGVMGGIYGGIAYGVTRFLADSDLANSVGLGVGIGLGAATGGILGGIVANEDSEKLAIQGEIRKSTLRGLQAGVEAEIGFITSGVVSGYEIGGIKGAAIGGSIGALGGLGVSVMALEGRRELGRAYREIIHPAVDPKNFPQFNIIKDVLYDDEDILLDHPPVYGTAAFEDMQGFRQAQIEMVLARAPEMKKMWKNPELSLSRMNSALFIIPDVTHYPAFDPESREVFFGKLKEPSLNMQLSDQDGNSIIVEPYKSSGWTIWPHTREFEENMTREFNEKRWQYWRGRSWKQDVVVLASRQEVEMPPVGVTATSENVTVTENYKLVDILVGGYGKGDRFKKKDPKIEKLRKLIPFKDPQGI